ncbi:MAG: DUF6503 family protein [Acidobacteriota bacterium]
MKIARTALFAAALLLLPTLSAADMPKIVEKAIAHHGGETFAASRVTLDLCSRSGCTDLTVETRGGLFDHQAEGEARDQQRRVRVTNQSVEAWIDGEAVELTAETELSYFRWVTAKVYFAFLPLRLADPNVFFEDQGMERWGERELQRVKVSFAEDSSPNANDQYLYWFDPESGRLEQFAYSFSGGLRFRPAFNYRRVGGLLFFDQKNLGINAPDLDIDMIDPEFVDSRMEQVSTVTLEDIAVEAIDR